MSARVWQTNNPAQQTARLRETWNPLLLFLPWAFWLFCLYYYFFYLCGQLPSIYPSVTYRLRRTETLPPTQSSVLLIPPPHLNSNVLHQNSIAWVSSQWCAERIPWRRFTTTNTGKDSDKFPGSISLALVGSVLYWDESSHSWNLNTCRYSGVQRWEWLEIKPTWPHTWDAFIWSKAKCLWTIPRFAL